MSKWIETTVGQATKFQRAGGTPTATNREYYGGKIPFVIIEDITNSSRYLEQTEKSLTEKGLRNSAAWLLTKPYILYSMYATVGKPVINKINCATNQAIIALEEVEHLDQLFLYYQLLLIRPQVYKYTAQTTQSNLNAGTVKKLIIFYPQDKRVQQKISRILTSIDDTIEKTEALIHKYQQIKAGLMHDLFTRGVTADGKLRPSREQAPELYKETSIGWIPKEWDCGLLNNIVNPSRPIVYGILMPGYGFDGGIPVVKVKDIRDRKIIIDNLLLTSPQIDNKYRRSKLQPNDILLTIRGTVGRICIIPEELEGANITQDTARIDLSDGNNEFYSYYFETDGAIRHFSINTLGVAVQGINLGEVRKTPIPKPPKEEQAEIAKRIFTITKRIDREKENNKKLHLLKSGLMYDLLTGKVPVKIDQKETAHV